MRIFLSVIVIARKLFCFQNIWPAAKFPTIFLLAAKCTDCSIFVLTYSSTCKGLNIFGEIFESQILKYTQTLIPTDTNVYDQRLRSLQAITHAWKYTPSFSNFTKRSVLTGVWTAFFFSLVCSSHLTAGRLQSLH